MPNAITLLRLASAPVLALLLFQYRYREALALALIAGLTDWLDGYIARRLRTGGALGIVLDPLADKVLLVTLFISLGVLRLIPLWMLILAIGRDLIIVGGALLLRIFRGKRRFLPSWAGKVSTFFQIVLVLLVLLEAAFLHPVIHLLGAVALWLAAVFTCVSGLDYIQRGIRMARKD